MLVVVASYRQNVHAYPSGGGDYEVATVNLGPHAGLTVASALLVDYVLTVAVSISSGVQNAKSLLPFIDGHEAWVASVAVLVLMALNLRGVRESGTLFAIPTYCFMVGILAMVGWGLFRILVLGDDVRADSAQYGIEPDPHYAAFTGFAMVALLARAFSSGCAALTGVEAISNGVPAFRKPKSKNAATTLLLLGTIAVTMLIGVITLANLTELKLIDAGHSHYTLNGERVDDRSRRPRSASWPGRSSTTSRSASTSWSSPTMLILFLAANTAFNGFPVLGSILARDGYLPRQLHTRGDRLAYSNGIIVLAVLAIVLIVAFDADVTALIQLYVVGVFVSFTVSQLGMMRHWTRLLQDRDRTRRSARRMLRSRVINAIGLTMTGTVLVIVLLSKFIQGAYIAIIAMAVLFVLMRLIRRHYESVARETALVEGEDRTLPSRVRAIVLVSKLHKPTLRALAFAKAARPSTLEALTVDVDPDETERLVAGVGGGRHRHPAQGGGLALPGGHQPDPRLRQEHPQREPARRGHGLHPRVRRRALVGADPAQPERAAAEGPAAVHPRRDGDLGALPAGSPPARPRSGSSRAKTPPVAATRRSRLGAMDAARMSVPAT